MFKLYFELFSPKSRSFNRAYNYSAILVDNADLFSIKCPLHVSNDTFVTIVYHFFEPVLFMHHPHNNKALFIWGSELLVLIVPLNYNDVPLVALQVLIHAQISISLAFTWL